MKKHCLDYVVDRLILIFDQYQALRSAESQLVTQEVHTEPPASQVEDGPTGLAYATECIGEVLLAAGGIKLMAQAVEAVERQRGADGGNWLSSRWRGLAIGVEVWAR